MEIFGIYIFSTIYILGAAGGTPRIKKFPKMAPEAFKWSNLNLQTLFGAYLCVKTTRFGVGTFEGVVTTPLPPILFRVKGSLQLKYKFALKDE